MLRSYLLVAFRNLLRHKGYALINILGLSTGLAATILLLIYIQHEISYDKMHEKSDRIYRIVSEVENADGKTLEVAATNGSVGPFIANKIPEVESVCRINRSYHKELWKDDVKYDVNSLFGVDTAFFNIFSFDIIRGDQSALFKDPYSLLLSEKMAAKIFKDESVVGKILIMNGDDYIVSGVFKNVPATSHMKFDAVYSSKTMKTKQDYYNQRGFSIATYILFREGTDLALCQPKLLSLIHDHIVVKFPDFGKKISSDLQNLRDIHLGEQYLFDFSPAGKKSSVIIFASLALFTLIIAVINFINLFIAKSEKRIKEVGVRKVLGALPKDLKMQFWGESTLLTLLSLFFAFVLVEFTLSYFGNLTNRNLDFSMLSLPLFWLLITSVVALIVFVSGAYPVFYLSRFDPAVILKGAGQVGKHKNQLKTFLVFFQFTIAIFLIGNILILNAQVKFIENKDLGFNKNEIIVIKGLTGKIVKSYESIKDQLLNHTSILSVTAAEGYPGNVGPIQPCYKKKDSKDNSFLIYENRVLRNYLETYQMEIVEGRNFNPELKSDTACFIINQAAADKMNFKNPIGERIVIWKRSGEIIGVVKNYNFESLYKNIEPLVFTNHLKPENMINYFSLRINIDNSKEVLKSIEKELTLVDPGYTLDYQFLNEYLDDLYKEENQTMKLIVSTSLVAIILSILGLFTLTSYIAQQKTKEIGVRKILGAKESTIILTMGSGILKWVILANLLAWPITYWVMSKWLHNFSDYISLSPVYFLLAGFIAFVIACLTVVYKLVVVARQNPVEALKYE